MKRLAILCVCVAVCLPAAAAVDPFACQGLHVALQDRIAATIKDLSGPLPIRDHFDSIAGCNEPQPQSAWLESERALYQQVLAKHPVDVLIVPFQIQGFGLDRIARSLMAAELAYAIADASDYTIADPFLVARALGEGARRYDTEQVESLARRIGAKRIIVGYVGHDLHHAFTLTLQVRELQAEAGAPADLAWQHDWHSVVFSDERTPELVFADMLTDVLRQLPLKVRAARATNEARASASFRITRAPGELAAATDSPVAGSAAFDLFGALGSIQSELSRERAFERALIVSLQDRKPGPAERFFRAYALTQLWRRPAALATLEGQTSAQAVALVAILNGDLPAAESAVAKVPQSLQRLLLDVGLRDLQSSYGRKLQAKPSASEQTFGTARPQWESLVALRAEESDDWAVSHPLVIKALLDELFPIEGLNAASMLRGNAVAHGEPPDEVDVDLANERHLRRAVAQVESAACCAVGALQPTKWDLLWLLEGLAESRISRSLYLTTDMQGLPQESLQRLSRYEPLLRGHPGLELRRGQAALRIYQKSADDTRANWSAQILQSATIVAHYAQGQTAWALGGVRMMGVPSPASDSMVDAYGYDYPRRPFWPLWAPEASDEQLKALALQGLAFSTDDVWPMRQLPPGDGPGQLGAVIGSLGSRFNGNPELPRPNVDSAHTTPQQTLARLQAALKSDPETWLNYQNLAKYIVTSGGSYESARDTFLKYPGFKERTPNDAVALSNYAYEAGSVLYWQGQAQLAQSLYQISADLRTGSEASLTSAARVLIIRGDYAGAASVLLERADRYGSAYGYRDYLSFLHAFGHSPEAWEGFSQIKASSLLPQVWVSALVGHDRQGMQAGELRKWLLQPQIREAQLRNYRFAPYYAILWSSTDHKPDADLGKLVEQLDGPPGARIDTDGYTTLVPSNRDEGGLEIVQPSPLRAGKIAKLETDTRIKSEMAYFGDAYAAVRWGDYDRAVARFAAMADHYPIEGYPLAFFAYAASKSGDKEHLERYLEVAGKESFDYWLAEAFFAAAHHDTGRAVKSLHSALRWKPNSDYRPVLTEYEYAQSCEWLFEETGDARFKDALLDWAKKSQTLAPTLGWAYAMEYAYANPGPERTRALAMTRFLSPASARIKTASKAEIDAADAWFHAHNPFQIPAPGAQPQPDKVAARNTVARY